MKKKSKVAVVMMMAIIAMAALTACGGKDADAKKNTSIVGTWSVSELEVSGVTIAMEEYAKQIGQNADTAKIELIFKEDKSSVIDTLGVKVEGTWEEKSGKYSITLGGVSQELSIEDGKLVYEDAVSGAKMTFEKK